MGAATLNDSVFAHPKQYQEDRVMRSVRDTKVVIAAVVFIFLSAQVLPAEPAKRGPAADGAEKTSSPSDTIEVPAQEDPGVAAVLAANPLTPRERVRAADVLLRLNRPDLAKKMLAEVLKSPLDLATLLALDQEFGSATFFRFASHPDLVPEGTNLATLVFDAVRNARGDAARLAMLVNDLCQASGDGWYRTAEDLIKAGPVAIKPLCDALIDPTRHASWPRVYYVLGQCRPDSDEALLSLLFTLPEEKRAGIIGGIAALSVTRATPFLVCLAVGPEGARGDQQLAARALEQLGGSLPTPRQAARLLRSEAEAALTQPVPLDHEVLTLLQWDTSANQIVAKRVSFEMWRRERAAYLAQHAAQLISDDPELRDLAACLQLERLGYLERVEWGWNSSETKPLNPTEITASDSRAVADKVNQVLAKWKPTGEDVNRWLNQCLTKEWYHAAWTAVCWMKEYADSEALVGRDVPALIRCLDAPDPELRFAATDAALRLAAGGSFRGASRVFKELVYVASSEGVASALVADPVLTRAAQMASYLKTVGYACVDTVSDGGTLLETARQSPDYEIILVSAAIQRPVVSLILQRLRVEPRLARVPVIVYADADWLPLADNAVRTIPVAISVAVPKDPQDLAGLIAHAKMLPGAQLVNVQQRLDWAQKAMGWLRVLAEHPPEGISQLEIEAAALRAVNVPQLSDVSLEILGQMATPKAQAALVEAASRSDWPIAQRVKALGAFRKAVEKRGVQLTTQQILRQYERYNQSAQSPEEVRKILGLILDCIEAPTQVRSVGVQAKE